MIQPAPQHHHRIATIIITQTAIPYGMNPTYPIGIEAPATQTAAKIQTNQAQSEFDDLQLNVTDVPEPSTLLLMAAAILGLLVHRASK